MNRYKPVGWRNESVRHYLAAKGIKTNNSYYSHKSFFASQDEPQGTINFTPEKFRSFKKRYQEAVNSGEEQFDFEGKQVLTAYGKYMIQYLEMQGMKTYRAEKEEPFEQWSARTGFQRTNLTNLSDDAFDAQQLQKFHALLDPADKERWVEESEKDVSEAESEYLKEFEMEQHMQKIASLPFARQSVEKFPGETDEQQLNRLEKQLHTLEAEHGKPMYAAKKQPFIDKYGFDSRLNLEEAWQDSKNTGQDVEFITVNEQVLADRAVLEQEYPGVKIMSPHELLMREDAKK